MRDIRLTAVILIDPGQEVREGHEAVVVVVPESLIHACAGAGHDRIRFLAPVVWGRSGCVVRAGPPDIGQYPHSYWRAGGASSGNGVDAVFMPSAYCSVG